MKAKMLAVESIRHLRGASVALVKLSIANPQVSLIDLRAWSEATAFMTRKLDSLYSEGISYDYGVQDITFKQVFNYEVKNENKFWKI